MSEANRFTPPTAEVDDRLSVYKDDPGISYEMRRLDFYIFQLVHQFRMPALQLTFVGFSVIVGSMLSESTPEIAAFYGVLAYLAQWVIQAVFLVFVVIFKNKRLYTRHEVKPLEDSLAVLTPYARQYYYWHGLEKVMSAPGFVAIYINKHSAHVVPNRAFRTSEARRDFITLIRTMRNA